MGSAHFLVGACRRLAEHLLAAYRREVARLQAEDKQGQFSRGRSARVGRGPARTGPGVEQPGPGTRVGGLPPAGRRQLHLRRRQEPIGGRPGQGVAMAGDGRLAHAADVPRPPPALWRLAAGHPGRGSRSALGAGDQRRGRRKAKAASRKPSNPVELLISPKHGQDTLRLPRTQPEGPVPVVHAGVCLPAAAYGSHRAGPVELRRAPDPPCGPAWHAGTVVASPPASCGHGLPADRTRSRHPEQLAGGPAQCRQCQR